MGVNPDEMITPENTLGAQATFHAGFMKLLLQQPKPVKS
jgi:hypothetical protein